jgi:hypothetical protein
VRHGVRDGVMRQQRLAAIETIVSVCTAVACIDALCNPGLFAQ